MELVPLDKTASSPPTCKPHVQTASAKCIPLLAATASYLLVGFVVALPLVFIGLPRLSIVRFGACMDGNFRMSDINSPFDVRTAFAVSLGFGRLEFAVAKGIDVVFDLVVGRGGQFLLAWLTYPVFTRALLCSMETRSASYDYFAAMAFETVSVSTMAQISQNMTRREKGKRSSRNAFVCVGLLFASLYVLSFPTLASAATGYSTSQEPQMTLKGGQNTTASWAKFAACEYVIEDGDRLPDGKKGQCITASDSLYKSVLEYTNLVNRGVLKSTDASSFNGHRLQPPPLQFSVRPGYSYGDEFYPNAYCEEFGFCKPVNDVYRWGFSYLLLFVIVVLTYVWAGVLVALHAYTRRNSRLAQAGRGLGLYRAVLDLAKAIREELGEEAQVLSNEVLQSRLAEASEGLRYQVGVLERETGTEQGRRLLSPVAEEDRESVE
ncbi:uncharacterized protein BKCO1_7600019 [Diplodia corticola]|uniref:Uncharacterized protein n=1 Tax=Diplodia corticola TaxID=236234 RepID=A0A1J9RM78_9PEZI|nr:uncharacterized protein BKCO1_7600019 [Diplodia corticola]OJD29615.1 hypothetical protein BKCO1_7600019 [Diplodia corticola]